MAGPLAGSLLYRYVVLLLFISSAALIFATSPSLIPSCTAFSTSTPPHPSSPPLLSSFASAAVSGGVQSLAAALSDARDVGVSPCDDFYHHACGGWINRTRMPDAELKYTRAFSTIKDSNQRTLQQVPPHTRTALLHSLPLPCFLTVSRSSLPSAACRCSSPTGLCCLHSTAPVWTRCSSTWWACSRSLPSSTCSTTRPTPR